MFLPMPLAAWGEGRFVGEGMAGRGGDGGGTYSCDEGNVILENMMRGIVKRGWI